METIKNIMTGVLQKMRTEEKKDRGVLVNEWAALVGKRVAAHTRPHLGQNGRLVVTVDQATMAFELNQKYRRALLIRIQQLLGSDKVNSVYFKIGQIR